MDRAGQEKSAHNARMRADAKFTETLEEVGPELEKAAKEAGERLDDGALAAGGSVGDGGDAAETSMSDGGAAAGESISTAAAALKGAVGENASFETIMSDLAACRGFLENIDRNLPQNAMS